MATSDQPSALKNDFLKLVQCAKSELDISDEKFVNLPSVIRIRTDRKKTKRGNKLLVVSILFLIVFGIPSSVVLSIAQKTNFGIAFVKRVHTLIADGEKLEDVACIIPIPELLGDKFRTPIDCQLCTGVQDIKRVKDLSPQEFLEKYAFSMQPVVIEDAQVNWTANKAFSFDWLKEIYKDEEAVEKVEKLGQFFPFQTDFSSLGDFFNMSSSRVNGKEKPWYVGWSNCDGKAANLLREHYKTPYFLPRNLDHSKTDWLFMGLPGYGAKMHIDNVGTHTWQAQIKGTKKWTLQIPAECHLTCKSEIEVVVKPGEIIVLDTNRWFHETLIVGNETSIVIGSEYF